MSLQRITKASQAAAKLGKYAHTPDQTVTQTSEKHPTEPAVTF